MTRPSSESAEVERLFAEVEAMYQADINPLDLIPLTPPRLTGDKVHDTVAQAEYDRLEAARRERIKGFA